MPFKSKAQRRKFAQLLVEGKISDETYEEWNRSTGRKVLPERVKPKDGAKTRKRTKAKKARSRARPKARPKAKGRGRARPRRKAK
jgi:hypothetical protein